MIDLSGDGVRAVLIGVGKHAEHSILPDVPVASATVAELADCLVARCGLDEAGLRTVVDPESPEVIVDAILEAATAAHNVLLIYYVGHGVLDPDGALYLATGATYDLTRGKAAYQALPFDQIGKELRHHRRIRATVVILDCCYSARATPPLPECFLIASADRDESAIVAEGARYPAFSGQLIRLLRDGDPLGPPRLTLRDTYRWLARSLPERHSPAPRVFFGGDTGDLVLTANNAYVGPDEADEWPEVTDDFDTVCPYRGLAPYEAVDSRWFRGRDGLTESVVRGLADRVWGGDPLVVLGSSGSGKSSLLRAGLLPALRRGDLGVPGSSAWPAVVFTPGARPLRALADAVREFGGEPADGRLVVVVDQFEELFTQCDDEAERKDFVAALWRLTGDDPPALVVLGLRSDFHGACTAYPELVGCLARAPVVVGPMTTRELRAAVGEPAELVGLIPQAGLVEILLRDVGADPNDDAAAGYDPGVLPFLSFALQETWRLRRNRTLTVDGYRSAGGIDLAVATAADATYDALDQPARTAAQHLLLRLVAVGEDVADTRRTAEHRRLIADSPDSDAASAALRAFVAARLLTLDRDTVEITHEALIRGWPRLRGWIDNDRAGNRVRQRLVADADEWQRANRDSTHLYTGSRLATAREHVDSGCGGIGPVGTEFLAASADQERRGHRRRRLFQSTLALLTVIAVVAAVVAVQQRGAALAQGTIAVQQRNAALSRQLAAESVALRAEQPNLAKQLALAGYAISPTADAASTIYDSLASPGTIGLPVPADDIEFNPDGRLLAIATDHDVRLWDLTRHQTVSTLTGDVDGVSGIAFDPAGEVLASVGKSDQTARLWQVDGPNRGRQLAELHGPLSNVAFSRDGHTLIAGGYDGVVRRWDVRDPRHPVAEPPLTGHAGAVLALAVSPDGRLIASGGADNTVRLSRMDGSAAAMLTDTAMVNGVAFSRDSHVLATVDANSTMRMWDITAASPTTLSVINHTTFVTFAPNADVLACTCDGPHAWDVTDPRHPVTSPLPVTDSGGTSATVLRFDPDGTMLADVRNPLGPAGGEVDLWPAGDLRHPGALAALPGQTPNVPDVAYSPRRGMLAIVTFDRTGTPSLTFWNLAHSAPRRLATLPGSGIDGLAFGPDGRALAVTRNGTVELWDVADPTHPVTNGVIGAPGSAEIIGAPAFSADGTMLATTNLSVNFNVNLLLWNVADPRHPVGGHAFGYASDFAFSPTGPLLAVGGPGLPTVELWDVGNSANPTRIGDVKGTSDSNTGVTISPDGRTLAAGYDTGTMLWDVSDPHQPSRLSTLTGAESVRFGPDGRTLAMVEQQSASVAPTVRLWDLSDPRRPVVFATIGSGPGALFGPVGELITMGTTADVWPATANMAVRQACRYVGDTIGADQWQRYLPDVPYDPPCH